MTDVAEEDVAGRSSPRRPRAELALKTLSTEPDARDRPRRVLELALAYGGAVLAAAYTPAADGDPLCLAESVGAPRSLYGLRDSYPTGGRSPAADVLRTGQAVWLGPEDLTGGPESRRMPGEDFSMAVLPLPGTGGCLVAVGEHAGGFDTDDRTCLSLVADAAGRLLSSAPRRTGGAEEAPPGGHLPSHAFGLAMDTGRVEAGAGLLGLFGLTPAEFDGRIETLLALTVPDDLPALMSVVEADHMSIGDRELEFRVLSPSGRPQWLRLRGRLRPAGEGRPVRLTGTVDDASALRPGVTDVTRVQRLAAALATAGTVRDVARAVVTALRGPLGADRIAFAGLENDRLVVAALDPPHPQAWPMAWRLEWRAEWPDAPVRALPVLASVLREGRARIWPAGTELDPAVAEVGPGGLALLPLPADGRTAGVCLIGWDTPHDVGPDERALLTACAGLAGQALVRARAFDAEHELVATLQRTLLPRRLAELPGAEAVARYLPTTAGLEVGGDWYDVIPLPDHHVALVIGDVQGHNAGAATLMGQMRTAVRAYATEGHPPDVVVSHANRLLMDMESDLFATCCYVDLDLVDGTAWCVRAGHLAPVLRHPDGRTEIVEIEGGPPLGVTGRAEFPMSPVGLRPGALLALTTDGLVESRDADIDVGLARLADALAGCDPARLNPAADTLLSDARREDDVALLLVRYDGMSVRPLRESWTVWRVPEAVRHARRFTRRTLRAWDVHGVGDAALLVVSELVTNALVHTDGPVRLDLTYVGGRLRIAVADNSPRTPAKPRSIGWSATGGRGILLVEAVSTTWGAVPVSGGKQVWSEILPET